MRIKVELTGSRMHITLKKGFNSYMQALIYSHLTRDDSEWLHNKGFRFEKRSFKLFTFSGILEKGQFSSIDDTFTFPVNISFLISSPVDWVIEQLAENLIKTESVRLGNNSLSVSSIGIMKHKTIVSPVIKIRCLTPIENHTTFTTPEGKKKTHYYTPYETEFSELTGKNLCKKWMSLYRKDCPYSLKIKPLFSGNDNEKIVYFGSGNDKTLVKGWSGHFLLSGEPEFLNFAYDTGLGSKNSQGFGMVEIANT